MKISKELMKGSTAALVLSVLKNQDLYGYKIIKEIALRSDDVFVLKEGTLYPLLHALEKAGDVRAYEHTAPSGRERRYYALTERGKGRLQEKTEEWTYFAESVNAVLRAAGAPAV